MFGTASIPNRPTFKLVLAALSLCLLALSCLKKLFPKEADWSLVVNIIPFFIAIWLFFFGTFCSPKLHKLWGYGCLIGGVLFLAIWVWIWVFMNGWEPLGSFSRGVTLRQWGSVVTMLLSGYLLIFDKDIAKYRDRLAHQFPTQDRLDPKVDKLPDDPINPS